MARIRSVHPAIWTDENFVSMSAAARLFFIGVWGEADDNGIFEWKPLVLKARLFPVDNVVIPDLLQELIDVGFVRQFEMQGKKLGAIKNFCKHQRPKAPKSFWDFPSDIQMFIAASSREDDPEMALKKRLLVKSGGACTYCRTQIVAASKRHNSMEIDHDIPVSRGGADDERNLVASCRPCNRTKYTRTGAEYVRFLCDRIATSAAPNATSEVASQMEDVGCRREEKKEDIPSPSEPGAEAPLAAPVYTDARHELWGEGKPLLLALGISKTEAGKLIGTWLKASGDDCAGVLDAIRRAIDARPVEAIPWITAAIPSKANRNDRASRQARPDPRPSGTQRALAGLAQAASERPDSRLFAMDTGGTGFGPGAAGGGATDGRPSGLAPLRLIDG